MEPGLHIPRNILGAILEAKKLAIVGGGVTKDKAPYDDPSVVIWSTASVGLHLPRVDAIFELHDGVFPDEDLDAAGCYVWMRKQTKAVKMSETFPIDQLIRCYGHRFNGTVMMMLGFGAIRGFKDISLYGVDFSSPEEYSRRVMFMWLVGYLSAQGIKITFAPGGYLQDECATYMYEDDGLTYLRAEKQNIVDNIAHIKAEVAKGERLLANLSGRNEQLEEIMRRY